MIEDSGLGLAFQLGTGIRVAENAAMSAYKCL